MPDDTVHMQPTEAQPAPAPQPVDVINPAPQQAPQPAADQPAPDQPPVEHGQSPEPEKTPAESAAKPEHIKENKPPKVASDKPIGVIMTALVVCTLLIAGVIYLQYLESTKETAPAKTSPYSLGS